MTYFIAYGTLLEVKKETMFVPTYRIARPHKIQIEEMAISNTPPNDYWEFSFLTVEDGNSIYTHSTKILPLFSMFANKNQGKFINPKVDIRDRAFQVLMGYQEGFRKMWNEWHGKDMAYKERGMEEMFKVIASQIENAVKA